jgi:uncharacterized protein
MTSGGKRKPLKVERGTGAGGRRRILMSAVSLLKAVVANATAPARVLFWALIGLILFGIVAIFVAISNSALIYAVLGLVIFAGLTAFDFQRLRRSQDIRTAPLLAASIFLDILNVFLLLLSLFGGSRD